LSGNGERAKVFGSGKDGPDRNLCAGWREMLRPGLSELLKAYGYANSAQRDLWDFAVEIQRLWTAGLSKTDFRWLACMGYVEHARETTRLEDDGREFRKTGNLSFSKRTCFVLTEPRGFPLAYLIESTLLP
jgi:hypothetical protein